MSVNVFERKEVKYFLTWDKYEALVEKLSQYISEDKYFNYKICNVYYDTKDYKLFGLSAQKPVYKEKLRLRSYGTPGMNDNVFLEIKKKYDGIVYKRRITLPLKDAYNFIYNKGKKAEDINGKEISVMLGRYDLLPQVYLSYDRYAYYWTDDPEIRITFDYNLKYRLRQVSLDKGDEGKPIIPEDYMILELKLLNAMPLPLAKALSELQIYPTSFSKVGKVYEEYIENRKDLVLI
jgi:SPX domain protein involved in polyphosphate accumulation